MNHIHNSTASDVIKLYGQFLLTNYNLGGKAYANMGFESKYNMNSDSIRE